MDGLAWSIGNAVLSIAFLFGVAAGWLWLSNSRIGRAVQALLATCLYFGWLGFGGFALYAMWAGFSLEAENLLWKVFAALAGTAMALVLFGWPVLIFNKYIDMLNDKLGLRLRRVPFLPNIR